MAGWENNQRPLLRASHSTHGVIVPVHVQGVSRSHPKPRDACWLSCSSAPTLGVCTANAAAHTPVQRKPTAVPEEAAGLVLDALSTKDREGFLWCITKVTLEGEALTGCGGGSATEHHCLSTKDSGKAVLGCRMPFPSTIQQDALQPTKKHPSLPEQKLAASYRCCCHPQIGAHPLLPSHLE